MPATKGDIRRKAMKKAVAEGYVKQKPGKSNTKVPLVQRHIPRAFETKRRINCKHLSFCLRFAHCRVLACNAGRADVLSV